MPSIAEVSTISGWPIPHQPGTNGMFGQAG
jgi:hypothetical protein